MSNLVATRTATELVFVVHDTDAGLPAREFLAIIESINFAIEFSGHLAEVAAPPAQPTRWEGDKQLADHVRIRRLRYGSPIEIVLDLQPLMNFLTNGGWLVFLGLVTKVFSQGATGWKTLEEAIELRRKSKSIRAKNKRLEDRRSPSATRDARLSLAQAEAEQARAMSAFITPLIEEAVARVASQQDPLPVNSSPGAQFVRHRDRETLKERLAAEAASLILRDRDTAEFATAVLHGMAVDVAVE
ncbi:hypothetical protein ACFQRL_04390 [Microbacterium fluvii]|uniref:Uncharacterized protein n=1 Tax=Microbacterium fluvii TaxID=415215 RepID=A0ABW2HA48_9MICO|nr:hypothetical protein [Microbacterium fluvii]MCU4671831.1 hypothetical protein [Microbacterium fluvii]